MKLKLAPPIGLVLLALALVSVTPRSKDRPAIETAYTQDACNCVRGHIKDRDDRPIQAARVSLLVEKTLAPVGVAETDEKGDFLFRSVPLKQELMLAVEAGGFAKATLAGITVRPSYSFVTTVRLDRAAAEP